MVFYMWDGDRQSSYNSEIVTIEEETEITAVFERLDHPLIINIQGEGNVTQKVIQDTDSVDSDADSVIELTAIPETGWLFEIGRASCREREWSSVRAVCD